MPSGVLNLGSIHKDKCSKNYLYIIQLSQSLQTHFLWNSSQDRFDTICKYTDDLRLWETKWHRTISYSPFQPTLHPPQLQQNSLSCLKLICKSPGLIPRGTMLLLLLLFLFLLLCWLSCLCWHQVYWENHCIYFLLASEWHQFPDPTLSVKPRE